MRLCKFVFFFVPLLIYMIAYSSTKRPVFDSIRLDRQIDSIMQQYHVPGLQLAVVHNEKVAYTQGYGYANIEQKQNVAENSVFRIASISKPITLATILKLFADSGLSVDSKVFGKDGILQFDYPLQDTAKLYQITVRHLLDHKAGFANEPDDPMFWDSSISQADIIRKVLTERQLKSDPGTAYYYSNFGYCLLGRIIEKVSNKNYADYVTENIFAPCGISSMNIAANDSIHKYENEVVYYSQESWSPYQMNVERMDSHGGWMASASDLTAYLTHIDRCPEVKDILAEEYMKDTYLSFERWVHTGSLPGTSTILSRVNDKWGYVVLANTRAEGLLEALENVMLNNLSR